MPLAVHITYYFFVGEKNSEHEPIKYYHFWSAGPYTGLRDAVTAETQMFLCALLSVRGAIRAVRLCVVTLR